MIRIAALTCCVILAACSATTPPPAVELRTVEVKVPVPAPCLPADKIPPAPEFISGKLTGDAVRDLDTVAASAIRLRSWGDAMHAALVACAQ